ncbi:YopX family protein [Lysinibacillus capsici]|uniref:YopX family protein n=1 Tax=Lysinibacillus capsici TaxID=2115968 RepID=UPI003BA99AFC
MREIKFRAWDKVEKRFWYFTLQEILERRMSYRGSWDEKVLIGEKTQYTGLKDKDDCEIYKGDIVRVHEGEDFIWTEQVIENSGGYWVDENYLGAIHSFCEVIGNIYEHNHLLEESQNGTK